ncbi:MAG: TolC family protein [Deltaproteobacteria bacterium]|nr:TolC family protein [Deltaproteobacteria bacterium]
MKQAYYRLALARQIKKITEEHISLIEQLIDAVRFKYEVGRAAQSDLLRLEILRDRLKDSVEDFDRQDRELIATINATLHRSVMTEIITPETFALTAPTYTIIKYMKLAMISRPQLKQLKAIAKMHRSAADLASTEAIPDPTFFASYALRSELEAGGAGRDLVTFGVGIPLPLFYGARYGTRAEEAKASARAADAQQKALVDAISGGLGEAHASWLRAFDQLNRYKDQLVPQAHKALEATFSNYQVDRADFSSLYEAEVELLSFERTIRVAAVQGLLAKTRVEQLIGRKL